MFRSLPRLLLSALLLPAAVDAQSLALEVLPFPGLTDTGRVNGIVEGPDARLWFCFQDRLQCHDGRRAHTISLEPVPGAGGHPNLRCVVVGPDGTAWLASDRGVFRIDPASERATLVSGTQGLSTWDLAIDATGCLWCRSTRELHVIEPDGTCRELRGPNRSPTVTGLIATQDAVWAWTQDGLWQVERVAGVLGWHAVPGVPAVRSAVADGADLLVMCADDVLRVAADGTARPLSPGHPFPATIHATAGPDGLWLADHAQIHHLPREGGPSPVSLWSRGKPLTDHQFLRLEVDGQGLLWLGTDRGVFRIVLVPGVENRLVQGLAGDENVTALAEDHDGTVWLGTDRGTLLRERGAGWQIVPVPWPIVAGTKQNTIDAMVAAPDGRLLIGTRTSGYWEGRGGTFTHRAIAEGVESVHALSIDDGGSVWVGCDDAVWRLDERGTASAVPLARKEPTARVRPCTFCRDGEGRLWLATLRGGLQRFDPATGSFLACGRDWQGESVLSLLFEPTQNRLFATTIEGMWAVETKSVERTLVYSMASSGLLRNLGRSAATGLWLALPQQLVHYDPSTGRTLTLPPRHGSHPAGYSLRSQMQRRNGELWFGALRGYARIQRDAASRIEGRARLAGVRFLVAGRLRETTTGGAGRFEVTGDAPTFSLEPLLVDRSSDEPPSYEIELREPAGRTFRARSSDSFPELPPGTYDATALVALTTGRAQSIPLGSVVVVPAPSTTLRWMFGGIAVLALGFLWWQRETGRRALESRRVTFDRLLQLGNHKADEILDVAFLAVATGENCMRRSGAAHASVWIHAPGEREHIQLAEFGLPCPDAVQRARRCTDRGEHPRPSVDLVEHQDTRDLLIHLRDLGPLEFDVLLHRLPRIDTTLLDDLTAAAEPAITGIRKHAWIERLEADFARRSATLEAEAHDLRSPLTVLRLGAHELRELAADRGDAQLQQCADNLSEASDRVLAAVESLLHQSVHSSPVRPVPADPVAVLARRIEALQPAAARKGIRIELRTPERVDGVLLDPVWFARVVDNVVGNAVKYSPRDSTVRITGEAHDGEFVVQVDDEGPGFPVEEQDTVFLPGVIGSAEPTGGESKTGMGLWIARQAVRSMGGRLWIGKKPEPGARVGFALPRNAAPSQD